QRSREQAGRATVRGKLLQEVAASLSEALTPTEVIETVVARAREGLRATGGALAVLTDDRAAFEIAGTVGAADALHNAWRRFPVHTRVPLADAGRSREVVTVESVPAGIARYPHLAGAHEKLGSLVAVPLVVDGRTVGALGLVFEEKRAFDADDLSFLRTLPRQCADAVSARACSTRSAAPAPRPTARRAARRSSRTPAASSPPPSTSRARWARRAACSCRSTRTGASSTWRSPTARCAPSSRSTARARSSRPWRSFAGCIASTPTARPASRASCARGAPRSTSRCPTRWWSACARAPRRPRSCARWASARR